MIYGYLLLAVIAIGVLYQVMTKLTGRGARASGTAAPFDVAKMRASELRLQYKFNFAAAVNFERNGAASGVPASEAKDAVGKCIIIRHRLDVIEGIIPVGGGDRSLDDYRGQIMTDVREAARGGQA